MDSPENQILSGERESTEAAAWFERIRAGGLSRADSKLFACWLTESPVNVRDYLGIAEAWGALQAIDRWPKQTREELLDAIRAMQTSKVVPLKLRLLDRFGKAAINGQRTGNIAVRAMLAATISIMAVGGIWIWWSQAHNYYHTARGEQRSVVLEDGSVVQLNTLTKIIVHFDSGHRRIEMSQGEAFFRVAHDASRPFVVETPFARVRAVGTEFNVYNLPGVTRVAVVEGRVQVASSYDPTPQPLALTAAQSADVGPKGKIKAVNRTSNSQPEMETATVWIQRRIVFDGTPLDTALSEFNRYNKLQMQIDDPNLGELRITGVFSADDPLALTEYLSRIQQVEVQRDGDMLVLRRNR